MMMTTDDPLDSGTTAAGITARGTTRKTPARRGHPAAGSRAVAAALSATAAATLVFAMGAADARNLANTVDTAAAPSGLLATPFVTTPTSASADTLPPVGDPDQVDTSATPQVTQAKPQPIVLQPQKLKVVAKSNGSR